MYGSNQIVHATSFNKPFDLSIWNNGKSFAWGLPPFQTTHYEFVDPTKREKWGDNKIWGGHRSDGVPEGVDRSEYALKLLADGIIRPHVSTSHTHYDCCGQWKTNKHMWWCEASPRYDDVTPKDTKKAQLSFLESLVLTKRDLKLAGFNWKIPSHLQWLLD